MRLSFDALVARVGRRVPGFLLQRALKAALGDRHVALCMHRVAERRRPTDWQPSLTMTPDELDALLALLLASRPGKGGWLSVTFDDGYEDAVRYVDSRAERFPDVEFLLFVCPEKVETRAGFRWDLAEEKERQGAPAQQVRAQIFGDEDVLGENQREDLKSVARLPDFPLADVPMLKRAAERANVRLGNHTNCHFRQTRLSPDQFLTEYQRSVESFRRQFGAMDHFAFPFGTPGFEFDEAHVKALRALGPMLLWSTERRPFAPEERKPGAVLPRFPVDGRWGARGVAAWITVRTALFRARGTSHVF